jgi:hypothetical protein
VTNLPALCFSVLGFNFKGVSSSTFHCRIFLACTSSDVERRHRKDLYCLVLFVISGS